MLRGREIVICAAALFAGNIFGDLLTPSPALSLAISLFLAFISLASRRLSFLLLTFAALGSASVQISRMPPCEKKSALTASAEKVQGIFSQRLDHILPEKDDTAGILKAMAIGDKGSIQRDLKDAYRKSGAMHLLALSGLHVGLIYALLSFIMSFLGGSRAARRTRSILTLAFLWQFALISGLSPSIFRAVLMISFYEAAGFFSGGRDGPAALAGSAIVTMLLQPESPRELSFQLSYSAVAGIYLIYPWLSSLLEIRKKGHPFTDACGKMLGYVWKTACLSISCQATCGVLAYIHFGTFPRYFLVTNLLAIPLATVVMYSTVAAVAASVIPGIGESAAGLLHSAIKLLNSTVRALSQM